MLFSGCKCRLAKSPGAKTYTSIKISKANDAFVSEIQPESSSIRIDGRDYVIKEAWVEHPHFEQDYSDFIVKQALALVVNFNYEPNDTVDLHHYVNENGNGYARIWVVIPGEAKTKETFTIWYRETLDSSKKNKTFRFFRKRL